jgi:uncharacterized protein (DUF2141 family)
MDNYPYQSSAAGRGRLASLVACAAALLALSTLLISPAPVFAAPAAAAASSLKPGSIEVTLRPRSNKGRIGCLLFASAKGFPSDKKRAKQALRVKVLRQKGVWRARCVFNSVKPGVYAVAVLHDENNNDKMDKSFFGSPKEGYGVSNDAKPGTFSGPKYRAATFRYDGKPKRITIKLRY